MMLAQALTSLWIVEAEYWPIIRQVSYDGRRGSKIDNWIAISSRVSSMTGVPPKTVFGRYQSEWTEEWEWCDPYREELSYVTRKYRVIVVIHIYFIPSLNYNI